ncbi:MAG: peroxiredoxin [Myxococcales bacterium]|nr:peroxiredoxin [Myxococcales bacterium]
MTLQIGNAAPRFELLDHAGEGVSLDDYTGRWLVLYFYPKDDTPGCTTEAIDFTAALSSFAELGAEILGVSPDSPEKHQTFIAKHALGVRLACDPEHGMLSAYGAWGTKKNYGKEYQGVIRSTVLIDPTGHVAHHWRSVKVKGHVDAVLEKLRRLAA